MIILPLTVSHGCRVLNDAGNRAPEGEAAAAIPVEHPASEDVNMVRKPVLRWVCGKVISIVHYAWTKRKG
jgi:hypothetical protein